MKKILCTWALLFSLMGLFSGKVESSDVEALNRAVVKITAYDNTGQIVQEGSGVVVGKESGFVFILTAYHVVKDSARLEVRYYEEWQLSQAQLQSYHGDLDIGVVIVKLDTSDTLYKSFPELPKGDPKQFAEVIGIGHPLGKGWRLINSEIQSLSYEGDSRKLAITKTATVKRGSSGGPLFDKQHFLLGIITEIDASEAVVVKIDEALVLLNSPDWGIPTNLVATGPAGMVTIIEPATLPAEPGVYSSGTACIDGLATFDFDEGTRIGSLNQDRADIRYDNIDGIERYFSTWGGSQLSYWGTGNFSNISFSDVSNANYSYEKINASLTSANKLTDGAIFFVRTNGGRLAKVQVEKPGQYLKFRWITYAKNDDTAGSTSSPSSGPCTIEESRGCGVGRMSGDAIRHFRVVDKTDNELIIDVDYTYNPSHGSQVYFGAYLLDENGSTLSSGYYPAAAPTPQNGTVRMTVSVDRRVPSKELFVQMYEPHKGESFACQRFRYTSYW